MKEIAKMNAGWINAHYECVAIKNATHIILLNFSSQQQRDVISYHYVSYYESDKQRDYTVGIWKPKQK